MLLSEPKAGDVVVAGAPGSPGGDLPAQPVQPSPAASIVATQLVLNLTKVFADLAGGLEDDAFCLSFKSADNLGLLGEELFSSAKTFAHRLSPRVRAARARGSLGSAMRLTWQVDGGYMKSDAVAVVVITRQFSGPPSEHSAVSSFAAHPLATSRRPSPRVTLEPGGPADLSIFCLFSGPHSHAVLLVARHPRPRVRSRKPYNALTISLGRDRASGFSNPCRTSAPISLSRSSIVTQRSLLRRRSRYRRIRAAAGEMLVSVIDQPCSSEGAALGRAYRDRAVTRSTYPCRTTHRRA